MSPPEYRVAAVVLAAGASRRMGGVKQLLPRSRSGPTLLAHAIESAREVGCDPIFVVLGAHAEAVAEAIAGLDVEPCTNPDWEEGIASSIRVGVEAAAAVEGPACGALLLILADQPDVDASSLAALLRADGDPERPVACEYAGRLGAPALFPRSRFTVLRGLRGDRGAQSLLASMGAIGVACDEAACDIDTPEDYDRYRERGARPRIR